MPGPLQNIYYDVLSKTKLYHVTIDFQIQTSLIMVYLEVEMYPHCTKVNLWPKVAWRMMHITDNHVDKHMPSHKFIFNGIESLG